MTDNPIVEPADTFYKNDTATEEPIQPTEEADVTKQEDQTPEQDVEKDDKPDEVKAETEELESKDEDEESLYVEIDGKEVDLEDVKKWRDGHMMQSDYTKKTTNLADERKAFETERDTDRENLLKSQADVSDMSDLLTVLVQEDESIDWVELKDDDPDRYIELKELADKRKEVLAKVKADRSLPADDPALIAEEQGKLFAANPEWFDDGKPTDVYKKDLGLMDKYAAKAGFSPEEFGQMTRAHHMTTILKAAKYDELQEKGREIKAKREKVPVVTKPKATTTTQSKSREQVFYGDKTG